MSPEERYDAILASLNEHGPQTIRALAETSGVPFHSLHRDLSMLLIGEEVSRAERENWQSRPSDKQGRYLWSAAA